MRGRGAVRAVEAERRRPWGAGETWRFRRDVSVAEERLFHEAVSRDQRLAVRRDVAHAEALSESVRRVAQPRRESPGVDFHRLSSAEHEWIYEELILPSLGAITWHERPVVVYVVGQPGAGKSEAAHVVRRALRGREGTPTHVTGDLFKAFHPDYPRLSQEQPRTAGARIRADYQAWQARVEAYVRDHRGDMVVEMAPGNADQLLDSAARAYRAGYRVEVVVVAVRAADSRQGTAARYMELLASGGPARFTTARGHDISFAALPDAVALAEASAGVDAVVLLRRDATEVYRNERRSDESWARPPLAAVALLAEQQRPYTAQEAARFWGLQRALRSALPQYRDELAQISALARALMPDHIRPRQLGSPPAPRALPLPMCRRRHARQPVGALRACTCGR